MLRLTIMSLAFIILS